MLKKRIRNILLLSLIMIMFLAPALHAAQLTLGIKRGAGLGTGGVEAELGIKGRLAFFIGAGYRHQLLSLNSGLRFYLNPARDGIFVSSFLGQATDFGGSAARGYALGGTVGYGWEFAPPWRLMVEGGALLGFDGSRIPTLGVGVGYKIF